LFQKEAGELIELYLQNSIKKIATLYKALEEYNIDNFKAAAQELRLRSIDIGAVQFSYYCLGLEMAVQEMCLERLPQLTSLVENKFRQIYLELEELKNTVKF
jgi:hypothetical protein